LTPLTPTACQPAHQQLFLPTTASRGVRKYVNQQMLKQLVHAFIVSRLDYCNSILAGLSSCSSNEFRTPPQDWYLVCDHETMSHLLYNNFTGCQSTTASNMHSVCQQQCPVYISNMVQSVANSTHRQGLWSSTCPTFVVPRTRTKLR